MNEAKRLRVLIADDHTPTREDARTALEEDGGFEVCAMVGDAPAAVRAATSPTAWPIATLADCLPGAPNMLIAVRASACARSAAPRRRAFVSPSTLPSRDSRFLNR